MENIEKKCNCDHPEIQIQNSKGCTLKQICQCHGNEPLSEILKKILFPENQ